MCWEACARMMWHWRRQLLPADEREARYRTAAGTWLSQDRGLQEAEMDRFYRQLEMRSDQRATPEALRTRLMAGPVILILGRGETRHACLCLGYASGSRPTYRIVNPCSALTIDFDTDQQVCTASGTTDISASTVERGLNGWIWYW
jgi:hypothetical protein